MSFQFTPEMQRALYENHGELEVIDPATNQCYVIVTKDRWIARAAGNQIGAQAPFVRDRHADSRDQWTNEKNQRRAELVDGEIAGTLTDDERIELEQLQQQMRAYREKVAPLPIEGMRQLHAELMEKARNAQAESE